MVEQRESEASTAVSLEHLHLQMLSCHAAVLTAVRGKKKNLLEEVLMNEFPSSRIFLPMWAASSMGRQSQRVPLTFLEEWVGQGGWNPLACLTCSTPGSK